MTLYEEAISMLSRLIGIVCLFLCTGCNAGVSIMKNYQVDGGDTQIMMRLDKKLKSSNLDDVKAFIESENFNINLPNKDGRTLLVAAVLSDDFKMAEKLLKLGANPNLIYSDYKGKSVMGWAASYKNDSYLKLLIKYDGDINLIQENQRTLPTPIFDAIAANRHENLRFLIENGANLDVVNKSGHTPLMFAITSASWEMVMM
ncbi:ankyrin repeat domain-containing protein, partial [Alishewanella sp. 16-MA]